MTIPEVAKALGMSFGNVYQLVYKGKLEAKKEEPVTSKSRYLFARKDVEAYLTTAKPHMTRRRADQQPPPAEPSQEVDVSMLSRISLAIARESKTMEEIAELEDVRHLIRAWYAKVVNSSGDIEIYQVIFDGCRFYVHPILSNDVGVTDESLTSATEVSGG